MFPNSYSPHIATPVARKHSNAPRIVPVVLPSHEFAGPFDYSKFVRVKDTEFDLPTCLDKIQSAREVCEEYLGMVFGGSRYDIYYDFVGPFFSAWTNYRLAENFSIIEIPLEPLVKVEGIWLRDASGVETMLDPSMYNVSQTRTPARLTINTWPFTEVLNYPYIEQMRILVTVGYLSEAQFQTVSPWHVTTKVPHGMSAAGKTPLYNSVRFRACSTSITAASVLPAPLLDRTDYYAQVIDDFTFTLSSDPNGVSPIHPTDVGVGVTFASLQVGGIPVSILRAILTVASHDRFAGDTRSLRKVDADTDMPKAARSMLKRFRKITVT